MTLPTRWPGSSWSEVAGGVRDGGTALVGSDGDGVPVEVDGGAVPLPNTPSHPPTAG